MAGQSAPMDIVKRFAPVAVLAAALALALVFDLPKYLSFETLKTHRASLQAFVSDRPFVAAMIYMTAYAVSVAISLPGAALLTIAGGFLFGLWLGTAMTVVAATLGATAIFLIAKTALGNALREQVGGATQRMRAGFQEDAFLYMVVLRLIPIFPFWLVNLVPAFLGVSLGTYILGTFLGFIPGTFVYISVGNGLGALFDAGKTPDLGIIFEPQILLPIIGLAALALLPVAYRKIAKRRANAHS
ncbi:MAG: TVP38/TMEM64 family protein [Geminicoccaceae bacterium]